MTVVCHFSPSSSEDDFYGSAAIYADPFQTSAIKSLFLLFRMWFYEPDMYFIDYSHPHLRPYRLLAGIYLFMISFVLIPVFNGVLFSFFSIPFYEKPLDTLTELELRMRTANHSLGI